MAYMTKKETDDIRKKLERAKVKDCKTYLKTEFQNMYIEKTEKDNEKRELINNLINAYIECAYEDQIRDLISGLDDDELRSGRMPKEIDDFVDYERWYARQQKGSKERVLINMLNEKSRNSCTTLYDDICDKIVSLNIYTEKVLKKRIEEIQTEMQSENGTYLTEDTRSRNNIMIGEVTEKISMIEELVKDLENETPKPSFWAADIAGGSKRPGLVGVG